MVTFCWAIWFHLQPEEAILEVQKILRFAPLQLAMAWHDAIYCTY
jgi:hypothetical protein